MKFSVSHCPEILSQKLEPLKSALHWNPVALGTAQLVHILLIYTKKS